MGRKLNIQPILVNGSTPVNLLNGAFTSLAGPIGFLPTQPRIMVKEISVVHNSNAFTVYKGASSSSTSGTEVFSGPWVSATSGVLPSVVSLDEGIVLESGDFLTAKSGGPVTINISAEIEF